ncbi:uncharacterized protein K452DRAFT_330311 [Aplosporella prunicola CBS 121167]|uniref:Homing endonuclease LAGLIDADG domain-containing protein n=1 Tax=Aplosporella prunicola CBS 121167 TaxID=1176127 RepID=A0A6A6AT25_9PEZI|nr:uncharacterized protein K452DRAFT_330311 [Aplosporella prunicola CBS 121167]KAF2135172.1 hypothetical protein K452DRAFT_330311 [Aplosporella prunicola CBS 121167]
MIQKEFNRFTDAEGNFLISIDRNYVRFKISLHLDDVETLNTIKSKLNIGSVVTEKSRNSCSFVVQDFTEIKYVICAIFNKFPLLTNFYKAVIIKDNNNRLSDVDKERVINLKNGINSQRFREGEGTFKDRILYVFTSGSKNTSQACLNAIVTFLTSLGSILKQHSKILPLNVVSTVNAKTNVTSLVVSSVDALYYYIFPLLDNHTMYTYKYTNILNKRYSTGPIQNVDGIITNIFERYKDILLKDPPFDVSSNIPHLNNVRYYERLNKSESPKTVYIYENGNLIDGTPFASFSWRTPTHRALGFYKSKSLLSSKPIDNASKI